MNKHLMLMGAAATALAGPAGTIAANSKTVALGPGSGGSSCPWVVTEVQKGVYAAQFHSLTGISTGQGLSRKTPQGKSVELSMSNNYFGSGTSIGFSLDVSLPFRTGGTWALWIEFSGVDAFMGNSGTYSVCTAPKAGGSKAGGGIRAQTMALIARLRAERAQR
jgi:hypothetical protein